MKPYDQLTRLGKIRRMRTLALRMLENYDLQVEWVKFLADDTNMSFKVRAKSGEDYVLRIYSDEETTLVDNQAEVFWLQALKRDTRLRFAAPVLRADGNAITLTNEPGFPLEKRGVLFTWVPGRTLETGLNTQKYFRLGLTMAELHGHAESLKPLPESICPKKWDKPFYYPNEPVVYNDPSYKHLFSDFQILVINQAISMVVREFDRLYSNQQGQILIHGDLHFWNIKYYQGELYLMDFEDVMLGYPVQDIAIALYYCRLREDYQELQNAFQQGYSSHRPWPVNNWRQVETLQAARMINFVNYVARIEESPQEYIDARCGELEKFVVRYKDQV